MAVALVVDDAADIRRLVGAVLRQRGFGIREAADGRQALGVLAEDPLPIVVVLDIQMPDRDGWEILAAIRADPRTTGVPVVLCTVRSHANDKVRGWALGCDGFVTKPFAVEALAEAVELACTGDDRERRARRQTQLEAVRG